MNVTAAIAHSLLTRRVCAPPPPRTQRPPPPRTPPPHSSPSRRSPIVPLHRRLLPLRLRLPRHQRPLQVAHRLLQPVLVLHQRDPHVILPMLPECPPRRQRHLRLIHHPQAELDRALPLQMFLLDLRPHEHAGLGLLVRPPQPVQPPAHHVPSHLVNG